MDFDCERAPTARQLRYREFYERKENGLELICTGPESLTPEFRPWAPEEYVSASWNGKPLL